MNKKSLSPLSGKQKLLDYCWKRLNPFSVGFLAIAGSFSFGWGVTAQEYPGCFLETPEGKIVPLPEVCQYPEPEPLPSGNVSASPQVGVYQAQIIARDGNLPVIEAVFNGQRAFRMVVDTGASNTVITPIMADYLGIIPTGRGTASTPSARDVEFDLGLVQSINVGGAVKDNLAVAIAPALVDFGLLGQDFFGQYDVTIKESVVEFRERSVSSPSQSSPSQPTQRSEPVGEPSQPFESRPVGEPSEVFESEPVGESEPSDISEPSNISEPSDISEPSNTSESSETSQPSRN